MSKCIRWSEGDLDVLKKVYPSQGISGVAKVLLDRTPAVIKRKAINSGISRLKYWTEKEKQVLRDFWYLEGSKGCQKRLPHRTLVSVQGAARRLSLKGNKGQQFNDISGKLFGNWESIEYDREESKRRGCSYYKCVCKCGKTALVQRGALVKKKSQKSCGHCNDIVIGKMYGYLEPLCKTTPYENPNTGLLAARYICLCHYKGCGNYTVVRGTALVDDSTESCGCLQKEIVGEMCRQRKGEKRKEEGEYLTSVKAQVRDSSKFIEFRTTRFELDNYTCQYSGEAGIELNTHHIYPEAKIYEEENITTYEQAMACGRLWDINNVITIAKKYHLQNDNYPEAFHSIYGTKDFTVEDFKMWFLVITPEFTEELGYK